MGEPEIMDRKASEAVNPFHRIHQFSIVNSQMAQRCPMVCQGQPQLWCQGPWGEVPDLEKGVFDL